MNYITTFLINPYSMMWNGSQTVTTLEEAGFSSAQFVSNGDQRKQIFEHNGSLDRFTCDVFTNNNVGAGATLTIQIGSSPIFALSDTALLLTFDENSGYFEENSIRATFVTNDAMVMAYVEADSSVLLRGCGIRITPT